ncbi:tripartite tricarboxylate transporter permease [Candidatus Micrarchaeota archaeon]|nr:tripartite tricarboxylate transporter permease [Candidatus Micrarchaeota archaeon]
MNDFLPFAQGLALGFLGGLMPGLHSNTLISVLASMDIDDGALALMIIGLFPAHMIASFVPSIFFGIPESGTVVAVLPGQRMVLRGEGLSALRTVIMSCVLAALLSFALFPVSLEFFPLAYAALRGMMGHVLLAVSLVLLARGKNPLLSAAIFLLSGILGHFALGSEMQDPFLPLFSGMFAMAAMANYRKGMVPEQKEPAGREPDFGFVKFTLAGVVLGLMADLIPGVGSPSQIATFATIFMPLGTLGYLAMISSVSVSQAVFSLATSASIGKSRVGATAWLSESIDIGENLMLLLPLFIISMALAALLVYAMRKHVARIASLDFSKANLFLALYLIAITFVIDGFAGLGILALSSALGLLTLKIGVERTNLMGAIIVPTLMLLFRIFF